MKNIQSSYIESFDDLYEKLNNLHKISIEDLKNNYNIINEEYSQEKVSKKFIDFIEKE